MSYKITVSGNFETKKGWSGLQKHMEHDSNVDHANKFLNSDISKQLRKYNQHIVLADFDKYCEKEFADYVKSHDKHHAKKEQYGNVNQFIKYTDKGKLRPQPIEKEYLIKLGDKNTYNSYISNLCIAIQKNKHVNKEEAFDMAMKTTVNGFSDYVKGFNQRNPNLKMFEGYIHADEEGAMHVHTRVLPLVNNHQKTKSGQLKKPSFSLNTALSTQYGMKRNGKKALAKFREIEDNQLLKALDNATTRELNLRADFKLDRKKDHDPSIKTGLDHDEYVRQRHSIDIAKLEKIEQQINVNSENLNKQNEQLSSNSKKLDKQSDQLKINSETLLIQDDQITKNKQTIEKQEQHISAARNIIATAEKAKKFVKNMYSTFYTWYESTRTNTPPENVDPDDEISMDAYNVRVKQIEKEYPRTSKTETGKRASQSALSMVLPQIISGLNTFAHNIMNVDLETSEKRQKTASKPISKSTGKNTHVTEKDDGLDF